MKKSYFRIKSENTNILTMIAMIKYFTVEEEKKGKELLLSFECEGEAQDVFLSVMFFSQGGDYEFIPLQKFEDLCVGDCFCFEDDSDLRIKVESNRAYSFKSRHLWGIPNDLDQFVVKKNVKFEIKEEV